MIFTSAILSWGLCALWGVFHSQSSVDPLLVTLSRLHTLSLPYFTAFLQISGPNTERLRTLDIVAPLEGADSFNVQLPLGDGFKDLKADPNPASNFTLRPNMFFAPAVQGPLHYPFLVRIVLSIVTGVTCLVAVYTVYTVIQYVRTGSWSTVKFILPFREDIQRAGKHIPALSSPLSPTLILDDRLEIPLASILLDDKEVDRNGSHHATPEDIPYDPLAFVFFRSPTSTRDMNILRSPVPAFVPPTNAAPTEGWCVVDDRPAWHPEQHVTKDWHSPQPDLEDPFLETTPAPRPLPPFTIMSISMSSLFEDEDEDEDKTQPPTSAPRPLLQFVIMSIPLSSLFFDEEEDEDESPTTRRMPFHRGEFHMQPEQLDDNDTPNTQPVDGWWPGNSSHPSWRIPRLDIEDPFLDCPGPSLPSFLASASLSSASSTTSESLYPSSSASASHALSASASYSFSTSPSYTSFASESDSSSLAPTFGPACPAPYLDSDEDEDETHVFGVPLFKRISCADRDADDDAVRLDEYLRDALGLQEVGLRRDFNTPPAGGWWYPDGYDDWEELDFLTYAFPVAPVPEELDDPFLYAIVPVGAG